MEFRLSKTFSESVLKLNSEEQKQIKITVFDLQQDPSNPGLQMHRITASKDPNFWSIRVNRDIRIIIHKSKKSYLVCYADHHDDAYVWAERRRIGAHPRTGAAQLIELPDWEGDIPEWMLMGGMGQKDELDPALADISREQLLELGVPDEWLDKILTANEDQLLEYYDHLPEEAAEAILSLASGEVPVPVNHQIPPDPFDHPDAKRRFAKISDKESLARALDFPWDKWSIYLHPHQSEIVEGQYVGPVRVAGSAGTGKTIVALHRAVEMVQRYPGAKVLLSSFSRTLASEMDNKLNRLLGDTDPKRASIYVNNIHSEAMKQYIDIFRNKPKMATVKAIENALKGAFQVELRQGYVLVELIREWNDCILGRNIKTASAYCDAGLDSISLYDAEQRQSLWPKFEALQKQLKRSGIRSWANVLYDVSEYYNRSGKKLFSHSIVDECQDIGPAEIHFICSLTATSDESLFFCGDIGQRLYQPLYSWRTEGVDFEDRIFVLEVNYRTSRQIRASSDKLLPDEIHDLDGNTENRRKLISLISGPEPRIELFPNEQAEIDYVSARIQALIDTGYTAQEIGIFVRTVNLVKRAEGAVSKAGQISFLLSDIQHTQARKIAIGTMHRAKGLEYRSVIIIGCDKRYMPLANSLAEASTDEQKNEVETLERNLLYVACTRARDSLLITGQAPGSKFLPELRKM